MELLALAAAQRKDRKELVFPAAVPAASVPLHRAEMASSAGHALHKAEEQPATPGGIGGKDQIAKEAETPHKEHDYVMVGEDSSREQVCTRLPF